MLNSIPRLLLFPLIVRVMLLLLMGVSLNAVAETQAQHIAQQVEVFQFKDKQDEQRAFYLARQLRCPKCQNQNLMESNASIAVDMKYRVFVMVDQGKNNQEILDFMTNRFGHFVLYNPGLSWQTLLLWGLPILCILLLSIVVFRLTRKSKVS